MQTGNMNTRSVLWFLSLFNVVIGKLEEIDLSKKIMNLFILNDVDHFSEQSEVLYLGIF